MTTNAELKRLAEAIGGETWQVYQHAATPSPTLYDVVGATRDDDVAECLPFRLATYIAAANPARIIALVDEVERLRGALDTAVGLLWEHVPGIAPRIEPLEEALTTGEVNP
jgi:hypothetical protein